ncbi:unnamed protein product [Chilo suppressalis]|uniref:EF-hand domain-containing protein n=1 Tax=Chilo suppressalis TaxID=168631 RepID=A0ABN8BE57_CHISP|nr:unnamed protein product [Chilo suppressalis]
MSAISLQEEELMQKSARAMQNATDPLEKLRLLCLSRGACGIMRLGRFLRKIDVDDSNQLHKEEFVEKLKESGLELDEKEAEDLFMMFDTDNSGTMSLDEFIRQIRPPMSESRRSIVEQAFRKLDKLNDGHITIDEIRGVYSVNASPSKIATSGPYKALIETLIKFKINKQNSLSFSFGIEYDNDTLLKSLGLESRARIDTIDGVKVLSILARAPQYQGECSEDLFSLIPPSPSLQRTTRAALRCHRLTAAHNSNAYNEICTHFFVALSVNGMLRLSVHVFPTSYNLGFFKRGVKKQHAEQQAGDGWCGS